MDKLNILVVEDEPMIAESVIELISCLGHNPVGFADNIKKTFEMIDQNYNDLKKIKLYFKENLPNHMRPQKINIGQIKVNHRFKKIN